MVHCRLTNTPSEYSICNLFDKLVAVTRNEIIHKHVVQHMKNILLSIFLLSAISVFSQNETTDVEGELIFLEYAIITKKCNELNSWFEKKECSKEEIRRDIAQKFDTEINEQLKIGKYRIWFLFDFYKLNGKPIMTIECDTKILKKEAERIITDIDFEVNLRWENNEKRIGKYKIPIDVMIRE